MKKLTKNQKIIIYTVVGAILLFFLWWIIAACVNSTLFPTPIVVIPVFFSYLGKAYTYEAIGGTFLRIIIAFAISFAFGLILGILAGHFYRFKAIMQPIVGFFRALPTAAVVLILIVLLSPMWTPIIVSSLVMFPLFYEAGVNGVENINKSYRDKMKLDHVSIFNSLFKIYIPLIIPYITLAIVQAFGLGMKVSIMAEILSGSNEITGLGRLIHYEYMNANATNVLAYSLIAILLIAIIDIILMIIKGVYKKHAK